MITVQLNGQQTHIEAETTVAALLSGRGVDPQTVVIEINLQIIDRERFNRQTIADGDCVEIIRFVGGG